MNFIAILWNAGDFTPLTCDNVCQIRVILCISLILFYLLQLSSLVINVLQIVGFVILNYSDFIYTVFDIMFHSFCFQLLFVFVFF